MTKMEETKKSNTFWHWVLVSVLIALTIRGEIEGDQCRAEFKFWQDNVRLMKLFGGH